MERDWWVIQAAVVADYRLPMVILILRVTSTLLAFGRNVTTPKSSLHLHARFTAPGMTLRSLVEPWVSTRIQPPSLETKRCSRSVLWKCYGQSQCPGTLSEPVLHHCILDVLNLQASRKLATELAGTQLANSCVGSFRLTPTSPSACRTTCIHAEAYSRPC
jgi:hypothetical protein